MKNLFKSLILLLVAALLVACGTADRTGTTDTNEGEETGSSELDGTKAVFNTETGTYEIEEGAQIRFGVDNDAYGQAIVALWDKTHPEHAGAVTFENAGGAGSADELATQQGTKQDVFMAIDGEVPRNAVHMLAFEENLAKIVKDNSLESFYGAGNAGDQTIYAPVTYDGMAFVTNLTMLESLGYDITDADGNNLPDAFDTWEEIFDLAREWKENRPTYKTPIMETVVNEEGNEVQQPTDQTQDAPVNVVFPFSLDNEWSDYFAFTVAGWNIFAEGDPLKPGYEKPEFVKGYEFLLEAKEAGVSVEASGETTPGTSMTWRWDGVIDGINLAPFGLVGTWQDVAGLSESTGNTYAISTVPTYNGVTPSPFVKSKGFVINGYTQYQSAAMELMRLIYSQEGLQAMVDSSTYAPSLVEGSELAPNLDGKDVQAQFMSAFVSNYPEPAYTLPENPAAKAMDAVFYGNLKNVNARVWDGEITPEQAVAELIEVADAKLAEMNKAQ